MAAANLAKESELGVGVVQQAGLGRVAMGILQNGMGTVGGFLKWSLTWAGLGNWCGSGGMASHCGICCIIFFLLVFIYLIKANSLVF